MTPWATQCKATPYRPTTSPFHAKTARKQRRLPGDGNVFRVSVKAYKYRDPGTVRTNHRLRGSASTVLTATGQVNMGDGEF